MNREFVIINQDSGYLTIDIANAFVKSGFRVKLFTGRLIERNNKLDSSVDLKKITAYNRSSTVKRLVTWSIAFIQSWFHLLFISSDAHLIIISNPPFAPLLPLLVRRRFSLYIFDIYPEVLCQSGLFKNNSFIVRVWKSLNKQIYSKASIIITLTESMKKTIQSYTTNRIEVLPVWTDNHFFRPVDKCNNPFIDEQDLKDKFVVMYSGNLGRTHNLECIIEIAAQVKEPDIIFLIIGEGESKDSLVNKATGLGLNNLKFLPWQSADKLPYSFAAADLAIVTQAAGTSSNSIPSKTYNFLSAGIPVIAVTDSGSELSELTRIFNCGKAYTMDSVSEIPNFIKAFKADESLRTMFQHNARKASLQFTPENANRFINLITDIN